MTAKYRSAFDPESLLSFNISRYWLGASGRGRSVCVSAVLLLCLLLSATSPCRAADAPKSLYEAKARAALQALTTNETNVRFLLSLTNLPTAVQAKLRSVADAGQHYSEGCVGPEPRRRLIEATKAGQTYNVAFEQGGFVQTWYIRQFVLDSDGKVIRDQEIGPGGIMVAGATGAFGQERSSDDEAYYKSWIGCKAPPIRFDRSDRTNYAQATYEGKKVLLYSFDAGNFAREADLGQLTEELESLHRVRTKATEPFFVIGYTRGVVWHPMFGMKHIPKKLDRASQFPIANLTNKRDANALGEPYELLDSPGAILIGTNGIICAVYLHRLSEQDFRAIAATPAWGGPVRAPPEKRK